VTSREQIIKPARGETRAETEERKGGSVIAGIYHSRSAIDSTIERLIETGISRDRISVVISSSKAASRDAALFSTPESRAGASGGTGATAGAVVGAAAGFIAGLGLFAVPGIGPLLAIGLIAAALSGVAAGFTAGGLVGSLVGLGVAPEEANSYDEALRQNAILLAVNCDDKIECGKASSEMEAGGAEKVSGHGFPPVDIPDDLMFPWVEVLVRSGGCARQRR
jgi:hypothetical protein